MSEYVRSLESDNRDVQIEGATNIRKLLSSTSPEYDRVFASGAATPLVKLLGERYDEDPKLQFEAAWAITNMLSSNSNGTTIRVADVSLAALARLVATAADPDLQEQVVWAIGNTAGDGIVLRDRVLAMGLLTPLLAVIDSQPRLKTLQLAVWTVSNMCRPHSKQYPSYELVRPALPSIVRCLEGDDVEMLIDACWSLAYLSQGDDDSQKIDAVLATGVLPRLISLLPIATPPALRTIGNIACGSEAQTQAVVDTPGALVAVRDLLVHRKMGIRKEAAWTLSNVAAGTVEQVVKL